MIHPLPQTTDHVEGVQVPDLHKVTLRVAEEALKADFAGEYRKSLDLWDLHAELCRGEITRPLEEVMLDIS